MDIKLKLGYLDKQTRNHLAIDINKAIDSLQKMDINLLTCNVNFEGRNNMIKQICDSDYKHIKEEFNKLK